MADTFWTTCYECKMKYELEFVQDYLNKTLLCEKCKQPLAVDQQQPASSQQHVQVHGSARTEPTGGNVGSKTTTEITGTTTRGPRSRGVSAAAPRLNPAEIRMMLMAKGRMLVKNELAALKAESSDSIHAKRHRMDCNISDASMSVPDPDFHDFDRDRTETSFAENEVWAAYDDADSMPRFYAMVVKVVSTDPFKLKICWLDAKANAEFSSAVNWVGSGFHKTCGDFKPGKQPETCKILNSFSQKVKWSRGRRGTIRILPQKGDVWALYRNWSPDWNRRTPKEVIRKYEMVTVLDDYDEESGISVASLSKVAGFKTVFRTDADDGAIRRIPREEMFRFSHRVPNHILTGDEGPNAREGYVELDPAATPLEFLGVAAAEN